MGAEAMPPEMSAEELIALFEAKATTPPPESSQMLVRHLQCKESIELSRCLSEAASRHGGDNRPLAVPSELLPPLA
jgi:hypothetical protein